MEKTVITVVGKDTTGIIARSSTYLYTHNINILDIAQTVLDGIFNMMMIVDMTGAKVPFADCAAALDQLGEDIGVAIKCQKEEIFDKMHRI